MAYSLTVRDAIDSLRYQSGGSSEITTEANIRKALQLGLLQISEARMWEQYNTLHRIFLQDAYSTGTLTYDHTGGSSERLVTLTGTVPIDMATDPTGWDLVVGNVVARVSKYLSSTTCQLDETLNFGADVASGTSFQLFKSRYLLPEDYRSIDEAIAETLWQASYVQPRDWLFHRQTNLSPGQPCRWTVTGDNRNRYRKIFLVEPAPSDGEALDFWYQRKPRAMAYSGYNPRETVGTVTAANSTTITGTNTTFDAGMVGSIIRFGSSSQQVPDGLLGTHPYAAERIITAYTSATSITVDSAVTVTGVKYVVSDPIDVDPAMEAAFLRACEYQLGVLKKAKAADRQAALMAFQMALNEAAASDAKTYVPRHAGDGRRYTRSLGNLPYNSTVED